RCHDDPAAPVHRGRQDVLRALEVDLQRSTRVVQNRAYTHSGSQMKDHIGLFVGQLSPEPNVPLEKGEFAMAGEPVQVVARARGQVVQRLHAIASGYELLAQMRADEPGSARYERSHAGKPNI